MSGVYKKSYSSHLFFNLLITAAAIGYALFMLLLLFYRNRYFGEGYSYNIVPFHTIKQYIVFRHHFNSDIWFKNLAGNVVLFMPIGVFAPLLHIRYLNPLRLAALSVVMIGVVETAQMLIRVGSFDVDDIILNTAGALLGLAFTTVLLRPFKKSTER